MKCSILGVKVECVNNFDVIEKVRSFIAGDRCSLIFTPNPEIIYSSDYDLDLKEMLNKSDLSIPDGIGIVIASKILGYNIKERVTGIDTMLNICRYKLGSVFLIGSKPGVAENASKALKNSISGINIAGVYHGYFSDDESDNIINKINESGAEILFVGLGSPRQEKWLLKYKDKLNCKVAMVIGGSLDVISGDKKRAPKLIIKLGIEWLYRLCQEPWRYKRMLVLPLFILKVLRKKLLW